MLRFVKSPSWRLVAVATLVAGLAAGGLWLARGQGTAVVQAQESEPPGGVQPVEPALVKVSPRPTGVVIAIADDRASFTFRTTSGDETTVRVTERTVVQGRGDRPYTMALLRVGDYVRVKSRGLKQKDPASPPKRAAAARKPGVAATDGTLLARRVIVRPAADGASPEGGKPDKAAKKAGQPGAGKKKGGLDGGASQ